MENVTCKCHVSRVPCFLLKRLPAVLHTCNPKVKITFPCFQFKMLFRVAKGSQKRKRVFVRFTNIF